MDILYFDQKNAASREEVWREKDSNHLNTNPFKQKSNLHLFSNRQDLDLQTILKTEDLIKFDALFTCKIHGYSSTGFFFWVIISINSNFDSDEYYKKHSSAPFMKGIEIPMLLINSYDDPIVPKKLYKPLINTVLDNENFIFVLLRYGGHIGFVEGLEKKCTIPFF